MGAKPWSVSLDGRVELVAVLEALTGRNPCPKGEESEDLALARESLDARHDAVRLMKVMDEKAWRHRHPSLIILDFGPPPALAISRQREHYANAGKDDAVARLLPAARDFAARPAFKEWLEAARARHAPAVARVDEWIAESAYLKPVEDYLGLPLPHRYRFAVSPLLHGSTPHNVLYRPERPEDEGLCEIHSIVGHRRVEGGKPDFSFKIPDFRHTAWHEVCHTVVDLWTQERRAGLEGLSGLYRLMTGLAKAKYDGPPGWLHMIDEHLIRAVTCRLIGLHEGAAEGLKSLEKERRDGFALIGPVHELLKEYEATRREHPTLRDFYPRVEALLSRLHAGLAGARGGAR
ncbi:MAG: DUF4932 domain-containing protein [Elusimicrobiota bacterium]|nr:DUF4932 domain-containing protein [Elusimicrobiota bacterium]